MLPSIAVKRKGQYINMAVHKQYILPLKPPIFSWKWVLVITYCRVGRARSWTPVWQHRIQGYYVECIAELPQSILAQKIWKYSYRLFVCSTQWHTPPSSRGSNRQAFRTQSSKPFQHLSTNDIIHCFFFSKIIWDCLFSRISRTWFFNFDQDYIKLMGMLLIPPLSRSCHFFLIIVLFVQELCSCCTQPTLPYLCDFMHPSIKFW